MVAGRVPYRVCDYFAVTGLAPAAAAAAQDGATKRRADAVLQATVLSRYPLADHPDAPFPRDLPLFSHPRGLHLAEDPPETYSFSFILTEEDGTRVFGSALVFHEPVDAAEVAGIGSSLVSSSSSIHVAPLGGGRGWGVDEPRRLFAPKALCLLSHWPFYQQQETFLKGLHRLVTGGQPLPAPVERILVNYVFEVPLPPPGRIQVSYRSLPSVPLLFSRPPPNCRPLADYDVTLLFRCLSLENVILLVAAVATERRVLFVSSETDRLVVCAETVCQLMVPFYWRHVYIPVLPSRLTDFVCAPMPFLVGVHRSYLPDEVLLEGTVVVDLDRNVISATAALTTMPDKMHDRILKGFGTHAREPTVPLPATDRLTAEVVEATFMKLWVKMLRSYRDCLEAPGEFVVDKFDKEKFLRGHPDRSPFVAEMLDTQMFQCFVDDRYGAGNNTDNLEVLFFDEQIDKYLKKQTPFLSDTSHNHRKANMKEALRPMVEDLQQQQQQQGGAAEREWRYSNWPSALDPMLLVEPRPVPALISKDEERVGLQNRTDMSMLAMKFFTEKRLYSQHFHALRLKSSKQDTLFKEVAAYTRAAQSHSEHAQASLRRVVTETISRVNAVETGTTADGAWQALRDHVVAAQRAEDTAAARVREELVVPLNSLASAAEHQLKILFHEAGILEDRTSAGKALVERASARAYQQRKKYRAMRRGMTMRALSPGEVARLVEALNDAENAELDGDEADTAFRTILDDYEARMPEIIAAIRKINVERISHLKSTLTVLVDARRQALQAAIHSLDDLERAVAAVDSARDADFFTQGTSDFWLMAAGARGGAEGGAGPGGFSSFVRQASAPSLVQQAENRSGQAAPRGSGRATRQAAGDEIGSDVPVINAGPPSEARRLSHSLAAGRVPRPSSIAASGGQAESSASASVSASASEASGEAANAAAGSSAGAAAQADEAEASRTIQEDSSAELKDDDDEDEEEEEDDRDESGRVRISDALPRRRGTDRKGTHASGGAGAGGASGSAESLASTASGSTTDGRGTGRPYSPSTTPPPLLASSASVQSNSNSYSSSRVAPVPEVSESRTPAAAGSSSPRRQPHPRRFGGAVSKDDSFIVVPSQRSNRGLSGAPMPGPSSGAGSALSGSASKHSGTSSAGHGALPVVLPGAGPSSLGTGAHRRPRALLSFPMNLWGAGGLDAAMERGTQCKLSAKNLRMFLDLWFQPVDAASRRLHSAVRGLSPTLGLGATQERLWLGVKHLFEVESVCGSELSATMRRVSSSLRVTKGELKLSMKRFLEHRDKLQAELQSAQAVVARELERRTKLNAVQDAAAEQLKASTAAGEPQQQLEKASARADRALREFKEADHAYISADRARQATQIKHDQCVGRILSLFEDKQYRCASEILRALQQVAESLRLHMHQRQMEGIAALQAALDTVSDARDASEMVVDAFARSESNPDGVKLRLDLPATPGPADAQPEAGSSPSSSSSVALGAEVVPAAAGSLPRDRSSGALDAAAGAAPGSFSGGGPRVASWGADLGALPDGFALAMRYAQKGLSTTRQLESLIEERAAAEEAEMKALRRVRTVVDLVSYSVPPLAEPFQRLGAVLEGDLTSRETVCARRQQLVVALAHFRETVRLKEAELERQVTEERKACDRKRADRDRLAAEERRANLTLSSLRDKQAREAGAPKKQGLLAALSSSSPAQLEAKERAASADFDRLAAQRATVDQELSAMERARARSTRERLSALQDLERLRVDKSKFTLQSMLENGRVHLASVLSLIDALSARLATVDTDRDAQSFISTHLSQLQPPRWVVEDFERRLELLDQRVREDDDADLDQPLLLDAVNPLKRSAAPATGAAAAGAAGGPVGPFGGGAAGAAEADAERGDFFDDDEDD